MTVPEDFSGGPTPPPYGGQPGWNAPPQGYGAPPSYATASGMQNGMGIAALVIGLLSIPLGLVIVGGVFGALAVGLGIAGRSRVKKGLADNGGVALAGILTGVLGMLIALAIVGIIVAGGIAIWHSHTVEDLRHCLSTTQTAAQKAACQQKYGS